MKKFTLIIAFLLGSLALAQAPEKLSYQAVIRNASGQLVQNQNVMVKVSILKNSDTGNVVYSERLQGTTNANGLLSKEIGTGTLLSGNFSTIDWSTGNYYLKTETDPAGGTNYTIAGTSQLLSVPYAMYAKSAGKSAYSDKVRFIFQMKVGIDYTMQPLTTIYNFGTNTAVSMVTPTGVPAIKIDIVVPGLYHFDVNLSSVRALASGQQMTMSYTTNANTFDPLYYQVYAPFLNNTASCDKSFDIYFSTPQTAYFLLNGPSATSFLTINGAKISD